MAKELPTRIARQDEELQTRIHQDSLSLAKLRHRWVKIEGVTAVAYAASVVNIKTEKPLDARVVREFVNAYELWTNSDEEFETWSDCYAIAKMGEERREIAKAVVAASPNVTLSNLRSGKPGSADAREAIRDVHAAVTEAKAEGKTIDLDAEVKKAVRVNVIGGAADRAAAKAAAEKRKRESIPDLLHAGELIEMRGKLLKWGKRWDATKISVKNKNFLLATFAELTEAIETVTAAIDGSWEVDWDAELESLVKSNG